MINLKYYLTDPDGTEKFVFEDGIGILEIVRINTKPERDIYCVPSMYECKLGCVMCYLTINNISVSNKKITSEILLQCIKQIRTEYPTGKKGLHLSLMGVGEPLLNLQLINDLSEIQWVDKLSIASIFPFIPPALPPKVKIHYSLHSPIVSKRKEIIPNTNVNPLEVYEYLDTHEGAVEIHYTLIEGQNDGELELNEIIGTLPVKFPIKFLDFKTSYENSLSKSNKIGHWLKTLNNNGFTTEFYYPPGEQIQGSCGLFTEGFYNDHESDDFKLFIKKYSHDISNN